MAEPTTLYRKNETVTVASPSEAQRLIADGWSLTKPEATPQDDVETTGVSFYIVESTPENPFPLSDEEPDAEDIVQPARRGRKPKGAQ